MRSLRANLFLSVGSLLIVIALIGFFLPRYFINKDINSAASYLSQIRNQEQQQIDYLSKSWVIYRFIQSAAELDAISRTLQIENKSIWETAGSVIGQDLNIAIVQVTDSSHQSAVISVESAKMYTPLWARDEKDRL